MFEATQQSENIYVVLSTITFLPILAFLSTIAFCMCEPSPTPIGILVAVPSLSSVTLCTDIYMTIIRDQGPRDPSLLHLQATHRSRSVWRTGAAPLQYFRRRDANQSDLNIDVRLIPILQAAGFYGVARVSTLQLDWSLLGALVERWRPETHSFHLSMGECTITLQDVGVLLGLPIDGEPVMCLVGPPPGQSWATIIGEIFGQIPSPEAFNNSRLRLTWVENLTPARLHDDAGIEEIKLHAKCYLLQLFGGSLFTDHSGGLIHSSWVHFVRDLEALGGYAWGLAVLARLYREL
ncbi:protein MAIN-LIKE 1-like [Daucus carota subsp. sativus]|uniref:protein MAIN-LIKE 1-like n=1 Tax=Daucus carota subsp. sativus TaxID=79200 RepID=UPI00308331AC